MNCGIDWKINGNKRTVKKENNGVEKSVTQENQSIDCLRPDSETMSYWSGFPGSGKGYNQQCGGWEHLDTGAIYAIANWGNNRHWRTVDMSYIDASVSPPVVKRQTRMRHGFQAQMLWFFNEHDVDHTRLVPIRFRWNDAPVGSSYTLTDGPMKNERVAESLPAEIPRAMMHAVQSKEYLAHDNTVASEPQPFEWWAEDVHVEIVDVLEHFPDGSGSMESSAMQSMWASETPPETVEPTPPTHQIVIPPAFGVKEDD